MLFLRQSTAVVVNFGPATDKTDGVSLEVGLASAMDNVSTGIRLSKNGGTLAARSATVTATAYDAFGEYKVTLSTTDTGTLGQLKMVFNDTATLLPLWAEFTVIPAQVYDSLILGSDLLDVSVAQWLGTAPIALSSQRVQVDVTGALTSAERNAIADATLVRQMTESYAVNGVAPTLAQALFFIQQFLSEMTYASTTGTVKGINHSTTKATLTINSATAPTSITRAT